MTAATVPPPRLELLRQFVNTRDIEAGTDGLATAEGATQWLRDHELLGGGESLNAKDAQRMIRIRETIREAMAANHDGADMAPATRDQLNTALRQSGMHVEIGAAGVAMRPTRSGVSGAIGTLLVPMLEAMTSGTWERLKVCSNYGCRWAFYDESRSRGRKWCSMSVCGNRAKQETWRANRSVEKGAAAR